MDALSIKEDVETEHVALHDVVNTHEVITGRTLGACNALTSASTTGRTGSLLGDIHAQTRGRAALHRHPQAGITAFIVSNNVGNLCCYTQELSAHQTSTPLSAIWRHHHPSLHASAAGTASFPYRLRVQRALHNAASAARRRFGLEVGLEHRLPCRCGGATARRELQRWDGEIGSPLRWTAEAVLCRRR